MPAFFSAASSAVARAALSCTACAESRACVTTPTVDVRDVRLDLQLRMPVRRQPRAAATVIVGTGRNSCAPAPAPQHGTARPKPPCTALKPPGHFLVPSPQSRCSKCPGRLLRRILRLLEEALVFPRPRTAIRSSQPRFSPGLPVTNTAIDETAGHTRPAAGSSPHARRCRRTGSASARSARTSPRRRCPPPAIPGATPPSARC